MKILFDVEPISYKDCKIISQSHRDKFLDRCIEDCFRERKTYPKISPLKFVGDEDKVLSVIYFIQHEFQNPEIDAVYARIIKTMFARLKSFKSWKEIVSLSTFDNFLNSEYFKKMHYKDVLDLFLKQGSCNDKLMWIEKFSHKREDCKKMIKSFDSTEATFQKEYVCGLFVTFPELKSAIRKRIKCIKNMISWIKYFPDDREYFKCVIKKSYPWVISGLTDWVVKFPEEREEMKDLLLNFIKKNEAEQAFFIAIETINAWVKQFGFENEFMNYYLENSFLINEIIDKEPELKEKIAQMIRNRSTHENRYLFKYNGKTLIKNFPDLKNRILLEISDQDLLEVKLTKKEQEYVFKQRIKKSLVDSPETALKWLAKYPSFVDRYNFDRKIPTRYNADIYHLKFKALFFGE